MLKLLTVFAALTLAHAGGGNKTVGKPCVPGESAMGLYNELDLMGRVAIITGADAGIGHEVARALAARNATVVLACRKLPKALAAAEEIRKTVPGATVIVPEVGIDLSSMKLTRAFAVAASKAIGGAPVHWLVNDAAMANNPHGYQTNDTDQNGVRFEMLFEVNYVNQWLLTSLLMPQLRAGKGRVVNLVSKAYRMSCPLAERTDCTDLSKMPPPVISTDPNKTVPVLDVTPSNYGIAKLLMIRWTEELASRELTAATGVTAYTVDPGYVNTSMASQSSPFWTKLSCMDEGRKGAPCPVPANQGALTPTFLALAPDIESTSGQYYEWCESGPINDCLDSIQDLKSRSCALSSDADKQTLWDLSARWVSNHSSPIADEVELHAISSELKCPKLLQPLCSLVSSAECFAKCKQPLMNCLSDTSCRASLQEAGKCMKTYHDKSADQQLKCLVPDNKLRDDFFLCSMDQHQCIRTPKDNSSYPACREQSIKGDRGFLPQHLKGDWWKLQGWTLGEQYECRDCGQVDFWEGSSADSLVISSTWNELDMNNKTWKMNDTSTFGPRPNHQGFPWRMQHSGAMLGLSYLENFTVVHDGTAEPEPFVFLYGCGGTKQGSYVTGFVLGKTPTASQALKTRIDSVAVANGFDPKAWCTVDNTCPPL